MAAPPQRRRWPGISPRVLNVISALLPKKGSRFLVVPEVLRPADDRDPGHNSLVGLGFHKPSVRLGRNGNARLCLALRDIWR